MEATLDVKLSYAVSGVDQIVKGMDLMTKFKGANVSIRKLTNRINPFSDGHKLNGLGLSLALNFRTRISPTYTARQEWRCLRIHSGLEFRMEFRSL